jgi:hypothetical protein
MLTTPSERSQWELSNDIQHCIQLLYVQKSGFTGYRYYSLIINDTAADQSNEKSDAKLEENTSLDIEGRSKWKFWTPQPEEPTFESLIFELKWQISCDATPPQLDKVEVESSSARSSGSLMHVELLVHLPQASPNPSPCQSRSSVIPASYSRWAGCDAPSVCPSPN